MDGKVAVVPVVMLWSRAKTDRFEVVGFPPPVQLGAIGRGERVLARPTSVSSTLEWAAVTRWPVIFISINQF